MNNKFYVTFKTAKLLKEKGFNKAVDKLIHLNKYNIPIIESPEKYYDDTEVSNDYMHLKQNHYACPTKSEVIDWLESKGVLIEITIDIDECAWIFNIVDKEKFITIGHPKDGEFFTDRLEAEEAAIIEACELL